MKKHTTHSLMSTVDEVVWSVEMLETEFNKLFTDTISTIYQNSKLHPIFKYDDRVLLMTSEMGVDFQKLLDIVNDTSKGTIGKLPESSIVSAFKNSLLGYSDGKFAENIFKEINKHYSKYTKNLINISIAKSTVGKGKRFENSFELLDFLRNLSNMSPARTHYVYKNVDSITAKKMDAYYLSGSSGSPNINVVIPFHEKTRRIQANSSQSVQELYKAIYPIKISGSPPLSNVKAVYRKNALSNFGYFHFDLQPNQQTSNQPVKNLKSHYSELIKNPYIMVEIMKMMIKNNEVIVMTDNQGTVDPNIPLNLEPISSVFGSCSSDVNASLDITISTTDDPIGYQLTSVVGPENCPTGTTYQICLKAGVTVNPATGIGTITVVDGSGWCGMP
jgi:hypothetical protein